MNFKFENQGNNTYLVAQLPENVEMDSMTLGMITNNTIDGVASAIFMQVDSDRYIKYNITSKIALNQMFDGPVNKKKLLGVFNGICNALLNADEYMLEFDNFIYDMDKIFVNVSTLEVTLICVPVSGMEQNVPNAKAFFKNIMFSAQFDSSENNDYVGKIINYLNGAATFSVGEFKEVLEEMQGIKPVPKAEEMQAPVVESTAAAPSVAPAVQAVVKESAPAAAPVQNIQSSPQPVVQKPQTVAKPGMSIPGMPATPAAPVEQDKKKKGFGLFGSKEAKAPKEVKEKPDKKADKKTNKKAAPVAKPGMAIPGMPTPQPGQAFAQKPASVPAQPTVTPQAPVASAKAVAQQPVAAQPVASQAVVPSAMPATSSANFGETTILNAGPAIGETTVLGVANMATIQPYLVRRRNDEKIPLSKPVYRIGKEKSFVDYFISDNPAISRSHANFIIRENEYFVVDTNSTNHTFINGNMIQSNVEMPINHGDIVRLGNEEFEFRTF